MSTTLRLVQSTSERGKAESESTSLAGDAAAVVEPNLDDLSRNVYGVLGIPVDAIGFPALLQSIGSAADNVTPFLISTPNVNFLVKSQSDHEFRESMLLSNLCLPDGMPLIWIAKLLRIPIHERIAGADLFGRLKSTNGKIRQLRVFLLGGAEGTAATVCKNLNAQKCGLDCVGVLNPGFGTIEEMSTTQIIDIINSSQSDLLAVFFGAQKAQAWLMHNHHRLRTPIRAQFGATINFEAGTVKRAPRFLRSTGFEWLWRIKEEPYLWRRYWSDGTMLLRLLVTCVLPLSIGARWHHDDGGELSIDEKEDEIGITVALSGSATAANAERAISVFRKALSIKKQILIDVSKTQNVDPRFFGLFLMLRKQLVGRGTNLKFTGITPEIRSLFRLNRFDFLLADQS